MGLPANCHTGNAQHSRYQEARCNEFLKHLLLMHSRDDLMEEPYRLVIRNEIDIFRDLFKQWVATFEKDEYEDEWGLFI